MIELVRAGARGYVTKAISAADVGQAIRLVADGESPLLAALGGFALDAFARWDPVAAWTPSSSS